MNPAIVEHQFDAQFRDGSVIPISFTLPEYPTLDGELSSMSVWLIAVEKAKSYCGVLSKLEYRGKHKT